MRVIQCALVAFVAFGLAGCGAEVVTTAATGAAIKKQEVEAGKQMKEMADKKIDAAAQAIQQRAAEQEKADK